MAIQSIETDQYTQQTSEQLPGLEMAPAIGALAVDQLAVVQELPLSVEPSITDTMDPTLPGNAFFIPVLKWFERQQREHPKFPIARQDEAGHHYVRQPNGERQYLPGLDELWQH